MLNPFVLAAALTLRATVVARPPSLPKNHAHAKFMQYISTFHLLCPVLRGNVTFLSGVVAL